MTFPNWATFTPEKAAADLPRELAEAEKAIAALEASDAKTFEDLVWKMDDATRPLYEMWGQVAHMTSVMNNDAWRKVEEDFQPKLVAFGLRMGQSRRLYDLTKRLAATEKSPVRARILQRSLQGAELSGVALEGAAKTRFNEIAERLAKLSMDFSNAVLDATRAFTFTKDGKTYTIDDANYPQTMKNCADREVREALFKGRAVRAPENAARIDEILALRVERAKILGFETPADVSLATKSAPSVKAVFEMIDKLDAATVAPAAAEEAELLDGQKLAPWDRAYAAERLRERKYAYSEEELKRHFEMKDVIAGLFRMVNFLFDVTIEEVVGVEKPTVWHPDVRVYRVLENGQTIAHFYFDPFVRNGLKRGGAWMNEFANRRVRPGEAPVLPLALLVTNFPEPDKDGKCLLPFREVETLFHEFGHATQCMLTKVDEEGAAGINLVEWDAVEIASQFMENWCLDPRTGIVVPPELKAKVLAAKNFRAASACRRQLAFAKTDMLLHAGKPAKRPNDVKSEMFAHFGIETIPEDGFLNAFTHIFAGGYAAGYYGYKWSEVMSADCYGAFEEAGLRDDAAMRRVGKAYRDTILALGGSKSAREVFRLFRGRDPEITAMLRQQGLLKK